MPRNRFRCPISQCSEPAESRVAIAQHLFDFHHEPQPLLLLPNAKSQTYQAHLESHSTAELTAATAELKPYLCSKGCQAVIISTDGRKRHQAQCPGIPRTDDHHGSEGSADVPVISAVPVTSYPCSGCNQIFSTRLRLRTHYRESSCVAIPSTSLLQVRQLVTSPLPAPRCTF